MIKKNYGEVPKYLTLHKEKIETEYRSIREMHQRNQEEEEKKKRLLTSEEVENLREGLNKRLILLKKEYANFTHKAVFDTLVVKKKLLLLI